MPSWLPANRIALIVSILTAIATIIAAMANAFPSTADAAAAVGAVLAQVIAVFKFLEGSQRYDALVANQADKLTQAGVNEPEPVDVVFSGEAVPASEVTTGLASDDPTR